MNLSKQTKFIIAIAIQLFILLAIILFKVSILTGGTDVLIRIEPVDPRDPLRGDYITFQYSISNVNAVQFNYYNYDRNLNIGDIVYVPLRKIGKYWDNTRYDFKSKITKNKPNGGFFIKGTISSISEYDSHITYGIEEYFIPEGAGQGFNFRDKEAYAKVSIDDNGNAVLKQVYINDRPWP